MEVGRGKTVIEAIKKIGVTEQTYLRWPAYSNDDSSWTSKDVLERLQ